MANVSAHGSTSAFTGKQRASQAGRRSLSAAPMLLPHRTELGVLMKRFHVHVAVNDLSKSIAFYSAIFGEEPSVVKPDYAKWMLEDPRINFAISDRGQAPGVHHL